MDKIKGTPKTIKEIMEKELSSSGKILQIPDYQRPYTWNEENCSTLWESILEFSIEKAAEPDERYFLGTVVLAPNDSNPKQILVIDGQQRFTSILLLLRVIHQKLETMHSLTPNDEQISGLMDQVANCIWQKDLMTNKPMSKDKILMESLVATETDNEVLHQILKTGIHSSLNSKSLYYLNFLYFHRKIEELANQLVLHWKPFVLTILTKVVLLPIECDGEETALTIFSTLNDSGEPLSDADIFKARIYGFLQTQDAKKAFADKWKEISSDLQNVEMNMNLLFRYYSHYLRAKEETTDKEIGLRSFYSPDGKYIRLKESDLMSDLERLSDFWVNIGKSLNYRSNDRISKTNAQNLVSDFGFGIVKWLHILSYYPNDFWKYSVSVYFMRNPFGDIGSEQTENFLRNLTAFLFANYIEKQTVNAIKSSIYKHNIEVYNQRLTKLSIENEKIIEICKKIPEMHDTRIARGLLLLHAYLNPNQNELVVTKFDVEHIFPRVWQNTIFEQPDSNETRKYIERLGNKVVIEKKLNIEAKNHFFGAKKTKYTNSAVAEVISLSRLTQDDWTIDDIKSRDQKIEKDLKEFFLSELLSKP